MAELIFSCAACHKTMKTGNLALAGRAIRCPGCGQPVRIPAAPPPAPSPQPISAPAPHPQPAPPPLQHTPLSPMAPGVPYQSAAEIQEELPPEPAAPRGRAINAFDIVLFSLAGLYVIALALCFAGVFGGRVNVPADKVKGKPPTGKPPGGPFPTTTQPPGNNPPGGEKEKPPPFVVKPKFLTTIKHAPAELCRDVRFFPEDILCWITVKTGDVIHRWDAKTQHELPNPDRGELRAFERLSANGKLVVDYIPDTQTVRVRELPGLKPWAEFKADLGSSGANGQLVFSPDSKRLLATKTNFSDGKNTEDLFYFDIEKKNELARRTFPGAVRSPAILADGDRVVFSSGTDDNPVLVFWEPLAKQEKIVPLANDQKNNDWGSIRDVVVSAKGNILAASRFSKIKLLDPPSTKFFSALDIKSDPQFIGGVAHLAISDDGKWLAGSRDKNDGKKAVLMLWHVPSRTQVAVVEPAMKGWPDLLRFSPSGRYLAVVNRYTDENGIQVWDLFPDGVIPK